MLEQPRKRQKRYAAGKGEDSFIRNENVAVDLRTGRVLGETEDRRPAYNAGNAVKKSVNNAIISNAARKASSNAANSFKKSASRASSVTSMFEKEFGKKKPSKR